MTTTVFIDTHEYELHTFIGSMNENDDEDMPIINWYTAIDRSQDDSWLALIKDSECEYSECGIGGYGTEKELAVAIYNSFSGMTTADFIESDLFD